MGHEILGTRFITREKPAWHNIANRIFSEDEAMTSEEAMVEVAGDIEVVRRPLFYEVQTVLKPTDETRTKYERAGKYTAIVRKALKDDPEEMVLGITSSSWVAASYPQLASSLNDLSKSYKVETAGVLKGGGLAFLCFRAEDWAVRGDEMRSYFAANFSLTPGKGHKIFHSPVRVVCWNTNVAAESSATINLSIPHTADALQKMKLAARLVTDFKDMQEKAKDTFDAFAGLHLSEEEVETVFRAAFPEPKMPSKLRLLKKHLSETEAAEFRRILTPDLLVGIQEAEERYEKDRAMVEDLIATCFNQFEKFEPANLRGTAWAAYNAVTEVADWREGRNADQSAVLGTRAREKSRAYEAALALLKK